MSAYSTFVFRHKTEADARRVFRAIMRRWPMLTERRTACTCWSACDGMSVADAARMALDCQAMDHSERAELARDLLELENWSQCLAKFSEWYLEVADGQLVEKQDEPISQSASPPPGEAPITTAIEVGCGGKDQK